MKLLIDFGASRIKSTVVNSVDSKITNIFETEGSIFNDSKGSIKLNFFKNNMIKHLDFYYKNKIKIDKILACGEMHCFGIESNINKVNSDKFYLWRFNHYKTSQSIKELKEYDLDNKTNMSLRDGLPSVNLYSFLQDLDDIKIRLLTFPQILFNEKTNYINRSMGHSLGIYSINNNLVKPFNDFNNIEYPEIVNDDDNLILGNIESNNHQIPLTCFIGDLQAACLGSNLCEDDLLLNIGTGSQIISFFQGKFSFGKELRPYFKNNLLECITHIPAGRHFTNWCNHLIDINDFIKSDKIFWEILKNLNINDLYNVKNLIDFPFDNKKFISVNNNDELKNFLTSLTKSFLDQYISILKNHVHHFKNIKISGGIIDRIPVARDYLSKNLDKEILTLNNSGILTLIGLKEMLSFQNET